MQLESEVATEPGTSQRASKMLGAAAAGAVQLALRGRQVPGRLHHETCWPGGAPSAVVEHMDTCASADFPCMETASISLSKDGACSAPSSRPLIDIRRQQRGATKAKLGLEKEGQHSDKQCIWLGL